MSIGRSAFEGCSSLTSITIPDSVTSIGRSAFEGCSSLTNITVNSNNTAYSSKRGDLYNKDKTELLRYAAGKTAASFVIPDSVTSIGGYAFEGCSSLTSITIPDGVTSIGGYAFYGCSSLTSITIPDSVTSIEAGAFVGCSSLTNIIIPDSVTSIELEVFSGCSSLTSIIIPDSVTSIEPVAFAGCSSLTSIIIPDSVASIGFNAFFRCSSLTSITIPRSVKEIGDSAFSSYWDDDAKKYINLPIIIKGYTGSYAETYAKKNGLSFTALDVKQSYTVTFNSNGGTAVSKKTVVSGQKAGQPAAPVRKGYTFAGWYKGNVKYSFNSPVTDNVTLTARWNPVSYKITYKTNGGTLSSRAVKNYDVTKAVSLLKPTRKGYIFAGWYTDSKFKNKAAAIKKGTTGNKTLYAKWTKVSVKKTAVQNAVNVKGKKIRVTLKKVSGSKGYQIAYSTSKKFTKKTTKTKLVTKTGYTISKLKKGRTYYVRVRAYKTDSAGEKVYGKWSGAKQVTVRK